LDEIDLKVVRGLYEELEQESVDVLKAAGAIKTEFVKSVDMRYVGQAYELNVPLPKEVLSEMKVKPLEKAFIELYNESYGYNTGDPIVTVNWRLLAVGKVQRPRLKVVKDIGKVEEAIKGEREVFFEEYGDYAECPVYDRSKLFPGANFDGPSIVEEKTSTTVIPEKAKVSVDKYLNLKIQLT
jgi:N-methylhydantoinase A